MNHKPDTGAGVAVALIVIGVGVFAVIAAIFITETGLLK